jgi:hypothetical protein
VYACRVTSGEVLDPLVVIIDMDRKLCLTSYSASSIWTKSRGELLLHAVSGQSCPDTAMFHFGRIMGWCRRAAPQDGMKCVCCDLVPGRSSPLDV